MTQERAQKKIRNRLVLPSNKNHNHRVAKNSPGISGRRPLYFQIKQDELSRINIPIIDETTEAFLFLRILYDTKRKRARKRNDIALAIKIGCSVRAIKGASETGNRMPYR
jgi:hypothetical protein